MKAIPLRFLLAIFALLLGLNAQTLWAQEVLREKWSLIEADGVRVGTTHAKTTRVQEDGTTLIRTDTESKISMNRMGTVITMESEFTMLETEEGKPVRFTSKSNQSGAPVELSGEVSEGKVAIVAKTMGNEQRTEVALGAEVVGLYGLELVGKEKGFEEGTSYTAKLFHPEYGRVLGLSFKVLGEETVKVLGEELTLIQIESTMDIMPGVTQAMWVDEEGDSKMEVLSVVGVTYRTSWTTDKSALERETTAEVAESPDLFKKNFIKPDHPMHHPRGVRSATFLLKPQNPDIVLPVEDETQKITEKRDNGNVVLQITSMAPEGDTIPFPVEDPALAEYLKESLYLQCKDEDLTAAAKEAVGDEKDAYRAAKKLEKWVYLSIDKKSLDVAFASAKEVFQNRKGDCSEHAVLLAAMARSVGIPSRVAMGVEYVYGIFGWHMWTEVWAGKWIPLDATLASPFVDATHIKFADSPLNDPTMDEALLRSTSVIGNLEIDVVEYALDGSPVNPDSPGAKGMIEGSTYSHAPLGISFEAPEGWEMDGEGGTALMKIKPPEGEALIGVRAVARGYDSSVADHVKGLEKAGDVKSKEERKIGGHTGVKLVTDEKISVLVQPTDTLYFFEMIGYTEELLPVFEKFIDSVKIEK